MNLESILKKLPRETLFVIANTIKNRWDRDDFLKLLQLDDAYYGNIYKRPFPRKYLEFVPRPVGNVDYCTAKKKGGYVMVTIPIPGNPLYGSKCYKMFINTYRIYPGMVDEEMISKMRIWVDRDNVGPCYNPLTPFKR